MEIDDPIRNFQQLKIQKFNEEKYKTATSIDQLETERRIEKCFDRFEQLRYLDNNKKLPIIHRIQHIKYLESSLRSLSANYECLDSSRPWLVYWILNGAHLLNFQFANDLLERVVSFLVKCRCSTGGFAGGPGQYAHLAPTYAAVNALCLIGTPEAYSAIDKPSLLQFLWSVREQESGAFRMHVDGEIDVRGAYCAVSAAKLVDISPDEERRLFAGTVNWIVECQTYEGGIGGVPDQEAHGGYTFCGIASLALLGSTGKCDLKSLMRWSINKQMRFEGGFQGRTNKLVDGCYSFWCGAILPIVQALISKNEPYLSHLLKKPLFNGTAVQEYVMICCQRPQGGLLDKPDKPPDLYHTCYTLSGISIAQHSEVDADPDVIGDQVVNELLPTHPLYNVPPKCVWQALMFFKNSRQNENSSQSSGQRESSADFETFDDEDFFNNI